jgi:Uma2 family endonuclease
MGIAAPTSVDPTIYREEDDVGEHEIQTYILELLRPLVERYLRELGRHAHVGSDQYLYWREHDPQACVAPDLYVLPGVRQDIAIGVWKVWETGVVPDLVIEVVGTDPHKDYDLSPRRYAEIGVTELIVFDPFPGPERTSFAVYRREHGSFRQVESTNDDRVWSKRLTCWVRRVGDAAAMRLRLALGEHGDALFPTGEEAERTAKEQERAQKEHERAEKEHERAEKERERAEKEAALRRVAELEAELAHRSAPGEVSRETPDLADSEKGT